MQYLALNLFASMALAGPLSSSSRPNADSQMDLISRCEMAPNCETYQDANSKLRVRFKEGQEPGTKAFENLHKSLKRKEDDRTTTITVSDGTIWWGCGIDVLSTLDHVGDICKTSGHCLETEPWTQNVEWADPDAEGSGEDVLTINAEGSYPVWLRNGMVDAVKAVYSAKGIIETKTTKYRTNEATSSGSHWGTSDSYKDCEISKAPQEVHITRFLNGAMEGDIAVTVTVQPKKDGFCDSPAGQAAQLGSAVSSVFGAPGTALAAIFGVIQASCGN